MPKKYNFLAHNVVASTSNKRFRLHWPDAGGGRWKCNYWKMQEAYMPIAYSRAG